MLYELATGPNTVKSFKQLTSLRAHKLQKRVPLFASGLLFMHFSGQVKSQSGTAGLKSVRLAQPLQVVKMGPVMGNLSACTHTAARYVSTEEQCSALVGRLGGGKDRHRERQQAGIRSRR